MTGEATKEALAEIARLAVAVGETSEEKYLKARALRAVGMEVSAERMWFIAAVMARLEEEEEDL